MAARKRQVQGRRQTLVSTGPPCLLDILWELMCPVAWRHSGAVWSRKRTKQGRSGWNSPRSGKGRDAMVLSLHVGPSCPRSWLVVFQAFGQGIFFSPIWRCTLLCENNALHHWFISLKTAWYHCLEKDSWGKVRKGLASSLHTSSDFQTRTDLPAGRQEVGWGEQVMLKPALFIMHLKGLMCV